MIKAVVIAVAFVLLLILATAVGAIILLHPGKPDLSALNYRDMGDAVRVDPGNMTGFVDTGSYVINNTYTTVILDMTGNGSASSGQDTITVVPAGGNPFPGNGGLVDSGVGRIIVSLAGSAAPIVMPVQWMPEPFSQPAGNSWVLVTTGQAVRIGGEQPVPVSGLNISAPEGSPLGGSPGSDLVIESQIIVVEPGPDYATNGSTGGYNNEIMQGQEGWYESDVAGKQTVLKVDVRWKNPANKLRLMIYTPDGHILGPYYDDSDNLADGRINLDIVNPEGVAQGQWHYKVNGVSVRDRDNYYVRSG